MKYAALACLLVVAGASALPQNEVAPSDGRIADLWLRSAVEQVRRAIVENGLDPVDVDFLKIEHIIIDGLVEVTGHVENMKVTGASNIVMENVQFNIFLGRLDFDIVLPEISLSIGSYKIKVVYGDTTFELEVKGSVKVLETRLAGDAIIRLDGNMVSLININANFSVKDIVAEDIFVYRGRDISDFVSDLLNYRIEELLIIYRNEINTIIGEWIRSFVNWWW